MDADAIEPDVIGDRHDPYGALIMSSGVYKVHP